VAADVVSTPDTQAIFLLQQYYQQQQQCTSTLACML
jgi:hypothetical protein